MKDYLHPTGTLTIVPNGSPMAFRGHHAIEPVTIPMNRFVCETAECELLALAGSLGLYLKRFSAAWIYDGDAIGGPHQRKVLPLLLRAAVALAKSRGAEIVTFDDEDLAFARANLSQVPVDEGCTASRADHIRKACQIEGLPFGHRACKADERVGSTLDQFQRLMNEAQRQQEFWAVTERGHKSVADLVEAFR